MALDKIWQTELLTSILQTGKVRYLETSQLIFKNAFFF